MRRQKQCGRVDAPFAQLLQQLDARHLRHCHVQNEAIELLPGQGLKGGRSALFFKDVKTKAAEILGQKGPHFRIIIHN